MSERDPATRPPLVLSQRESPDARCAFCHDTLDELSAVCPGCKTVLHRDCRAQLSECPTLGCRLSVFTLLGGSVGDPARRVRTRPAFRRALARLLATNAALRPTRAEAEEPGSGALGSAAGPSAEEAGSEGAASEGVSRLDGPTPGERNVERVRAMMLRLLSPLVLAWIMTFFAFIFVPLWWLETLWHLAEVLGVAPRPPEATRPGARLFVGAFPIASLWAPALVLGLVTGAAVRGLWHAGGSGPWAVLGIGALLCWIPPALAWSAARRPLGP